MLNPNARTACIEVLLNESELSRLDRIRGGLGRSPYFRDLLHRATRTNGMGPPAVRESRHCQGAGRPASRGSGFLIRRQV